MLRLSRGDGARIRIGDSIVLTALRVRRNSVRIGIEAPKSTHVTRDELIALPPRPVEVGLA